jgi:arsenate reductase
MRYVLFVCTHNAGRSQMAQAFFERHAPEDLRAESAGSAPAESVWPDVVEAMREIGIDLSSRKPQKIVLEALREVGMDASDHVPHRLDDDDVKWADVVVATCDDACPVVPGKRYVNWHLPDPKGRPLEEVRAIRDDIAVRVEELLAEPDAE